MPATGPPRFFLFHRKRLWNPVQNCWMGWERKRGKLAEFNRLLLGEGETTYSVMSCSPDEIPKARFVITLDSDTQLPRETARRLIGTLAHPLNQAPVRCVTAPGRRRLLDSCNRESACRCPAARRSRFSQCSPARPGIDPYTTATSDVYQDLFGLGTFTGKGIYDFRGVRSGNGPRFPKITSSATI